MRISLYLKRLEKGNWHKLLHHRSKTTKTEIEGAVVKQLKTYYKYLKIGLEKVPDKHISEVLTTKEGKDLIYLILNDRPRNQRLNELDDGMRAAMTEISRLEKSDKKQDKNKVKSLRRRFSILQKEYDELNKSVDKRRLDLAQFMVASGLDYIQSQYQDVIRDTQAAKDEMDQLESAKTIVSGFAERMPKLRYLREMEKQYDRMQIEKNRKG